MKSPGQIRHIRDAREVCQGIENHWISDSFREQLECISNKLRLRWDEPDKKWQLWEFIAPEHPVMVNVYDHLGPHVLRELRARDLSNWANSKQAYLSMLSHEADKERGKLEDDNAVLEDAAKLCEDFERQPVSVNIGRK